MNRLRKTLILLLVVGVPAGARSYFASAPDLCFTAGSVTYQLSSSAETPDYRVLIDNRARRPDLRVKLVDRAEIADFALVDDAGGVAGGACRTAGALKTVKIVSGETSPDVTISVSREVDDADFRLFVHSARVTHQDAAALFALMRHVESAGKVAQYR